ncbi:MAG: LssY C-terminal domain-containing protein [Bryobacteraceae bacterium]
MTLRTAPFLFALASLSLAQQIAIQGDQTWVDTKLDVAAGETLRITGEGSIAYTNNKGEKQTAAPSGLKRGFRDLIKTLPVNAAGKGALVARIGDALPFLVGPEWEGKAPVGGRLFLGLNQGASDKAEGSLTAKVERLAAAPPPVDVSKLKLPVLTQQLLDSIAPRVQDAAGTPGDRVNFIVVGGEQQLVGALKQAGWVIVDKDKKSAVLAAAFGTFQKQAYVTMPMSELQLFGRNQDYGFAQGDPLKVVAARHHFRVWKAPFTLDGVTVFAGAGTHDIGFDKDQRTGGVTHKIDPDTDLERDYIGKTLQNTGNVAKLDYMTPANTITTAKTAHGEEFHSDGRTLVIYLMPQAE